MDIRGLTNRDRIYAFLERKPYDFEALSDLYSLVIPYGRSDLDARDIIEFVLANLMAKMPESQEQLMRWRDLIGRCHLFRSHYNVDSYFQYLEWNRDLDKRFYLPRRQSLQKIIQSLQDILDDKLDMLTISQPPGSGKTTTIGFFMSMMMGLHPDRFNLISAHSDKLTYSMFEGVLSVLTDPDYTWGEIFPGVQMESKSVKNETINLGRAKRFKTLTCRSIDGTLTGATRFNNLMVADDLVSGIEEALSIDRLDKLWEKVNNDLRSRGEGRYTKEIYVATRWSVNDPIGRLERRYENDERFRSVVAPALDENDESNFDFDYGLGFTTKYYHDLRSTMDDLSWRALYMNEPVEREGLLFDEPSLRRYYQLPDEAPDAVIGVCDTKDRGRDYGFLPVAYQYGSDYYIEDCVCDNGLPEAVEAKFVDILLRHKVQMCRFESNAAGGRVADKVNREVREKGGSTHITKQFTTTNKETKIIVNSHWVKTHCLFKNTSEIKPRSDYATMMRLLLSYTQTGKNKVDDVPDGMAMLAEFASSLTRTPVHIFQRPV